jgi:hypothetical protein
LAALSLEKKENMKNLIIFVTIILLTFTSCDKFRTQEKKNISNSSIENFNSFYDKFHKDSLFQLSRIKFPLKGGPDRGDINEEWTKENWHILKTKIYDVDTTQYKVSYKKLEKSFIEKVWLEDSGFSFEYKFELIDNKWFLVSAFENNN